MTSARRDALFLVAAAVAATVTPALAAAHLRAVIDGRLEPRLSEALGESVRIGGAEAGLTGTLRLDEVAVGDLVRAEHLEASVSLASLLDGHFRPDEVRVHRPRVRTGIDDRGRLDLERLVTRASGRARGGAGEPTRLRRVVVTGGELELDLRERGRLGIRDLSLHPTEGGVRAVAGETAVELAFGPVRSHGTFERLGADIRLPGLDFRRLLADGGALRFDAGGAPLRLTGATLSLDVAGESGLTLRARSSASKGAITVRAGQIREGTTIAIEADDVPLMAFAPLLPRGVDLAAAHGDLVVRAELPAATSAGMGLAATARLSGVRLDDRRLALAPVPFDGDLELRARADAEGIALDHLRVRRGEIELEVKGALRLDRGWRPQAAALELALAPISCATLLGALPAELTGHLVGMDLRGQLAGRAEVQFDRATPADTRLGVELDPDQCRVLAEPPLADVARLRAPLDHTFPDGRRAILGAGEVQLAALPRYLTEGFVAAEDARFFRHRGFDLHQIERSLAVDLEHGAIVRGGSTISQQLAKNLYLGHHRTVARKLEEAVLTWRLERHLDKRLILERYLEVIELGEQVYGVSAGAQHWFGKRPRDLTVREAAFLIALTPAPTSTSRRIAAAAGVDPQTVARVDTILRVLRRARVIDERAYQAALAEPLRLRPGVLARAR